jgi:small-conductance mechanosensitive channel
MSVIDQIIVTVYNVLEYSLLGFKVADLLKLVILLAVLIVVERVVRKHVVMPVLRRTQLGVSLQYAIGRMLGYALLALGFLIGLQNIGINLSSLAILAGAVGVGVGFGLQNIVNNFVSGLIILAEQPIAIGDRIEVGGVAGQVREINLRSTTVVTNDNISIIVPNASFISNTVTNWSYGDPKVRFRIPFGVAYGSDVEKLRELMLEVAREHPKALAHPAPNLFFLGFGDSSLNFELSVWTVEMTFNPRRFRSELYFAIEKKLRDNGIEIPFPQRDVHFRSGSIVLTSSPKLPAGE